MAESHRMSRGHCRDGETIGLLCTEGFMIMKVDPNTKMVLEQVRYCGAAEAAGVCDSTIIHQDA